MKKRFISTLLVAITTIGALTGCGSSNSNVAQAATETTTEADTAEATTEEAPAGEPIELKIGVVGSIFGGNRFYRVVGCRWRYRKQYCIPWNI